MSRKTIADALRRLREKSGLTANQVGEMVGKSGKTINAWENNRGQPDAEMLLQLCDIYNVDNILNEFREEPPEGQLTLTAEEKQLVLAYRENPDLQNAVKILLGLRSNQRAAFPEIKRVARSGTPETSDTLTAEEAEAIAYGRRLTPTDEL